MGTSALRRKEMVLERSLGRSRENLTCNSVKLERRYPLVTLAHNVHMRITVSLWNLRNSNEDIRLFAFQDAPEFRTTGGLADLRRHEVLEFLERAGMTKEEAQWLLEDVLRQRGIQRRLFQLSPEQLALLRDFTPDLVAAL
jgi:hypothetical protein